MLEFITRQSSMDTAERRSPDQTRDRILAFGLMLR